MGAGGRALRAAAMVLLGAVALAGCGGDDGGAIESSSGQQGGPEAGGGETPFPVEAGSVSRIGDESFFVSGGFLAGAYAAPTEARGNPSVLLDDADLTVRQQWELDLTEGRHLFGAAVVADGDGWVIAGAECEVLTGAETPGGCTGGAPRMWRLLPDETSVPVPLSEEIARHGVDGPVGAGYLRVLAADGGRAVVTFQTGSFVDAQTSVGDLYRVDLESGAAEAIALPAALLAPGQVCVRPAGDLLFVEPVLRPDGLGYDAARVHVGQQGDDGVRWSEVGSFAVELSFDTSPRLTCSADRGVVFLPSTSELYVFDRDATVLEHHTMDGPQISGVTLLGDDIYVASRDRVEDAFHVEFARIGEDGSLESVGGHEVPAAHIPVLVELGGRLFDAGALVAASVEDRPAPELISL